MNFNHLLGEPHWDEVISEFNCTDGVDARVMIADIINQIEETSDWSLVEEYRVIQSGARVRKIILNHYLKRRLDYLCPQVGEKGMQLTRKEYHVMIISFLQELAIENDLSRLFGMVLKCNHMIIDIKGEKSFSNFLNELRKS